MSERERFRVVVNDWLSSVWTDTAPEDLLARLDRAGLQITPQAGDRLPDSGKTMPQEPCAVLHADGWWTWIASEPHGELAADWQLHVYRTAPPRPVGPIPMILFCPSCGLKHIDAPQPEKGWTNPPHRSHECQGCGFIWRPADIETTGVYNIPRCGLPDHLQGANRYVSPTGKAWCRACNVVASREYKERKLKP